MERCYSKLSILEGEINSSEFTSSENHQQSVIDTYKIEKILQLERISTGRKVMWYE